MWIIGNMSHNFIDTTDSDTLNLSVTLSSTGDANDDRVYLNYSETDTTLTWIEFESV